MAMNDVNFLLEKVIAFEFMNSKVTEAVNWREGKCLRFYLYTRYPIVARALGLADAFRPSARAIKGILHTC